MGESVITEIVPFGENALNKSRIGGAVLPDDEECGVNPFSFRMSRILGVHCGSGPSSKVSAILPGISPALRITKDAGIFV